MSWDKNNKLYYALIKILSKSFVVKYLINLKEVDIIWSKCISGVVYISAGENFKEIKNTNKVEIISW